MKSEAVTVMGAAGKRFENEEGEGALEKVILGLSMVLL
jgi:hypothetical protein